ncbi:MAG: hypothetical protein JW880_01880 [Candidatus Thermoplasmatota archaeon]|nr:hypothetical protein [Candidatus Thermoplasmatota archaeon]
MSPSEERLGADFTAVSEATLVASPNSVYVGEEVTFFANATSSTSSSLKFTIFYDAVLPPPPTPNPASHVTVNVTGNPGNVVQWYTYDHPGNFSDAEGRYFFVRLWVDDGEQNVSRVIKVHADVNTEPSIVPRPPSQLQVDKGVPIDFSIKVTDRDNDTLNATWDFGDGTVIMNSTGGAKTGIWVNQTHTWDPYVEPGTGGFAFYCWMNFTVEDPYGHSNSSSTKIIIQIQENIGPSLNAWAFPLEVDPADFVTFVANASDPEGEALNWTFDYGDDAFEVFKTDPTPPYAVVWMNRTHQYSLVGTHIVTISVTDAIGENQVGSHNSSRKLSIAVVENVPPYVVPISYSGNLTIDVAVGYTDIRLHVFVLDINGDPITATWYLNGEQFATNTTPGGSSQDYELSQIVRFNETGTYMLAVNVTDGWEGHWATVNRTLNITSNNRPPSLVIGIAFNYSPNMSYALPDEVLYYLVVISDPERDPIELIWDFGDGSPRLYFNLTEYDENGTVTSEVPHSYSRVGEYAITIWFTDNKVGQLNHSKTVQAIVSVDTLLVADAGPDQYVLAGEEVFFDSRGTEAQYDIENWSWTFMWQGSRVTLYGEVASFVFDEPWEAVLVTLNVTDSKGNLDQDSLWVYVGEMIPELPSVVLPSLAMMTSILAAVTMRHRKREC